MNARSEGAASPERADGRVRFARTGSSGAIVLDRPSKLNALTLDMVRDLAAAFDAFEADDDVRVVTLAGDGSRAFCAGGDIARLLVGERDDDGWAHTFWSEQYRVDARIARFAKPIVAFMHGIVMGGGVGLSAHASHRIVTDSTRLAMPETAIGLIPDVGATWLLPRAPGELGTYVALTGARIGAADAIALGLADYYVPESAFEAVRDALANEGPRDTVAVHALIARFARPCDPSSLAARQATIDRAFASDTVEGVREALSRDGSDFARATIAQIDAHSPTSSKLTLRALRVGRSLQALEDCLQLEYRVMNHLYHGHDLREGIRAVVIDKDRSPAWHPASLEEVSPAAVAAHFAPLFDRELQL